MKNDVTINFSVDVVRTNVAESEVLETIYSIGDLSKRGRGPFVPMPGSTSG